jgi:3-hydroxyisobutyrate dehydrogenase
MTQPTIAFLGIGLMGAPMARRLLAAGLKLTVWNRSRDKAEPLAALGAVIADTPAIAAKDADIVCLCLTDAKAVEAVLFGLDGVAGVISPEAASVDFSTIGLSPRARWRPGCRGSRGSTPRFPAGSMARPRAT